MVVEFPFDAIAITALAISSVSLAERWRGGQRARQEANILTLSNQISEVYGLMDENLLYTIKECDKDLIDRKANRHGRMLIVQKLHIHLDSVEMMIKMESRKFMNLFLPREHSQYYKELVGWYCSVYSLYNQILDVLGIRRDNVMHLGTKDTHRHEGGPPAFLANHKYALELYRKHVHDICRFSAEPEQKSK